MNSTEAHITDLWHGRAQAPGSENLNPANKKVVFLVGNNATAHSILNNVLRELASMGIHADVYLTETPKTASLQRKLSVPENSNFAFYERLAIDVIYPIIENAPMLLIGDQLDEELKYSPRQLAEFYASRGINIKIENLPDVNDPAFIQRIRDDSDIVMAYNLRSLQILKPPIIDAFNSKRYALPSTPGAMMHGYIANAHPGPLPSIPGTHTAFWSRMNGKTRNEWTLHVIDEGIDTGPTLDTCSKAAVPDKTLLQSLNGMDRSAAQMVVTNTRLFFEGRPRAPLPQKPEGRPQQNYSYPTPEEWRLAREKGIIDVHPERYLLALAKEFTGGTETAPHLFEDVCVACIDAIKQWQNHYVHLRLAAYGETPILISTSLSPLSHILQSALS